jgi:DNA polymerase-3 subunit gamma/tau
VGQEHVVRTLTGAIAADRIGHAYLFAGPRGTGKTTLARIFAKAINCTAKKRPCGACANCTAVDEGRSLDLVEIDAASNRSIDDIRTLKETVGVAPTMAAYKVYLMDEAHMLTKEASNALLKVLEEPPAHVVFILATTEAHKMISTVLSRVQRFDFKKLTQQQVAAKLSTIANAEKLTIEPAALATLAAASDGALRDAEVMLTKLASHSDSRTITAQAVQSLLGLVPVTWHAQFVALVAAGDRSRALAFLHSLVAQGTDPDQFTRGLLEYLRLVMLQKIDAGIVAGAGLVLAQAQQTELEQFAATMDGALLVRMMQTLTRARTELKGAAIASLPLELAVIELTQPSA